MAVFLFSKNVHDETLPVSIQTMSCKLLLNLVECIRQKAETEPAVSGHIYEFVLLFKVKISLYLAVECECLHPYWYMQLPCTVRNISDSHTNDKVFNFVNGVWLYLFT